MYLAQDAENHKKFLKIAGFITSWDEVTTLGIGLHCDPNDLARLKGDGFTIKGAAYEILRSWYERRDPKSGAETWESLNAVLWELGKSTLISELKIK